MPEPMPASRLAEIEALVRDGSGEVNFWARGEALPELITEVRRAREAEAEALTEIARLRHKVTGAADILGAQADWLRAQLAAKEA